MATYHNKMIHRAIRTRIHEICSYHNVGPIWRWKDPPIWTPEPGIGPDCLCQVRMTGIWSHAKWFHTWPLGAATVVHSHPCSIPHTAAKRGWPGFQLAYSSIEIIHDIKSLLNNHIEFEFHNLSRNNHIRNRRETDDAMPWRIHIRDSVQQARLGMQIFLFAHWGRPAPFEPTFRKAHDPKVFLSAIFFDTFNIKNNLVNTHLAIHSQMHRGFKKCASPYANTPAADDWTRRLKL